MDEMKIFTGRAHPELARKVCDYLGIPLGHAVMGNFPDGEISCKIDDNVRGGDVFIIQPTCPPCNENLMELLIMIDSFLRASAGRITAVIPYFGYARQDRKDEGRVPITAKLVANIIARAGTDRVLAMDLHAAQIQGFFDIPTDHLYAAPVIDDYLKKKLCVPENELVVVSPDEGAIKRALAHMEKLGGSLAIIDKRRSSAEKTNQAHVIGSQIEGKVAFIFDDMISTGSSICGAAKVIRGRRCQSLSCGHSRAVSGKSHRAIVQRPDRRTIFDGLNPFAAGKEDSQAANDLNCPTTG